MKPVRSDATYADLEALPEHVVGELIDGELWVSPRPAPIHASVNTELLLELGRHESVGSPTKRTWRVLVEPEIHLGRDVLVPDIAAWRMDRLPALPEKAYFDLAPDWICEVLSPGTARLDRVRKLPRYARVGVGHAWIVEPRLRTLDVFRRNKEHWTLASTYSDDDRAVIEPFDFEVDLSRIWPPPPPSVHENPPSYG